MSNIIDDSKAAQTESTLGNDSHFDPERLESIMKETREIEASLEFRPLAKPPHWLYEIAHVYVPDPGNGSREAVEIYEANSDNDMTEFTRCRWRPSDGQRLFTLTVSLANSSDYPHFGVDLYISSKNVDPISISSTASQIRVIHHTEDPFIEFLRERYDEKPAFGMRLFRSGRFDVIGR